jgi:amino acid transporter
MSELNRIVGLPLLLFFGLGNILGAGIYVLIGKVAGVAGLYMPFAFLIAAVIASFSAFTYSELTGRYPLSAG